MTYSQFAIRNSQFNLTRTWLLALPVLAWIIATQPLLYVVALATGLLGLPLIVRQPWLIWPGLAVLLPITSSVKIGPISLSEGLLAIAVALWFADGVRRRSLQLSWPLPALVSLLYALFLYLALLNAANFAEALAEMLKWVEFALVIVLVTHMTAHNQRHWLVIGLLAGGTLQGLIGFYQFALRIGPDWFLFLGRFMRAYGTFSQPNPYAGYLGLTLPVAVSLALYGLERLKDWKVGNWRAGESEIDPKKQSLNRSISQSPLFWLLVGTISSAIIALGLLLSWSRGGWLGAIVGIGVVVFGRSRGALAAGLAASLVLITLILFGSISPALIPAPIASRLADLPSYFGLTDVLSQPLTDENFAVVERIAHWVAAVRMWELSPWIGVGPGNYATLYPAVKVAGWDEPLGHAHNLYLNLLAETGILGLLIFLAFWISLIGWTVKKLWQSRKEHESWVAALLLGLLGVVAHLFIHNVFDNLLVQGMYLHLALWFAAIVTMNPIPSPSPKFKEGS